jgi:hypothetical protein
VKKFEKYHVTFFNDGLPVFTWKELKAIDVVNSIEMLACNTSGMFQEAIFDEDGSPIEHKHFRDVKQGAINGFPSSRKIDFYDDFWERKFKTEGLIP